MTMRSSGMPMSWIRITSCLDKLTSMGVLDCTRGSLAMAAGVLRRVGLAVRGRQAEDQEDQVRAGGFSRLGPLGRVIHGLAPGLIEQGRPIVGPAVADLDRPHRRG